MEYFGRVRLSATAVPVADPVTVPVAVAITPPLQSTAIASGHHQFCPLSSTGLTNPQPSQNTRSSVAPANEGLSNLVWPMRFTGCHAARYPVREREPKSPLTQPRHRHYSPSLDTLHLCGASSGRSFVCSSRW